MNSFDLITIMGNISQSLGPVQKLLSGMGYLLGILLIMNGLIKLKKVGESRGGGSQEKAFVPLVYILIGSLLIFLPSTIQVFSNTAFGVGNILQYSAVNPYDIKTSMIFLVKTAGLLWFVRGCMLLIYSSQPGSQGKDGPKGITFIIAGILAMNFEGTYGIINYLTNQLLSLTNSSSSK